MTSTNIHVKNDPTTFTKRLEPWRVFTIIFALAGAAIAVQLWVARNDIRDAEIKRLMDVSRYVSENLTRQIRGLNEALVKISRDYRASALSASSADASRQLALLTDVIQAVQGLAVYDANGIAITSDQADEVGKDFFGKGFFRAVREKPDASVLYLSRPTASDDSAVALHLSRAVFDESGQFTGVVSADLNDEFFAFVIRSGLSSSDMRATLAHPDGEIFVTVPSIQVRRQLPNISTAGSAFETHVRTNALQTVYEGLIPATGRDRLLLLNSVRPSGLGLNSGIVFSVSRERSNVYAPWREQARLYVGLYLAVLVAAIALRVFERRRRRAVQEQEEAAQSAIKLGAMRLERALDGAQLGLWELQVDSRQLHVDARGARMLGQGQTELTRSSHEWTDMLHPADRQGNTSAFAQHLRGVIPVYENEFRVQTSRGDHIWLFSRGKVTERADGGEPVRVIGTFMDITARKVNEAALADAVLLQKKSGEIARIGGWILEASSMKAHWTDEVYRIHDLDSGQALDLYRALDFYTADSRPIITAAVMEGMRHGTTWDLELQIVSAKGALKWVRVQGEAMYRDNVIERLTGAFQDITASKQVTLELERLNAALSELSFKDALTGLGNRRMFDDMLTAEWGRHARQEASLALLMIDIDHFKRFNDSHGHLEGDDCLRRVSRVLKHTLWRTHEKVMRYGGEEFAILLPDTSLEGAVLVAQRLLDAIASAAIPHGASPVSDFVTLSIGAAAMVPDIRDVPSTLTRLADSALYEAKTRGRARIVASAGEQR